MTNDIRPTLAHVALLALLLAVQAVPSAAQLGRVPTSPQEAAARRELSRMGVDETALRARLLAKGIDVDAMSVQELAAARPRIEATVAELKAEQAAATQTGGVDSEAAEAEEVAAEAIEEGVELGESIREAVEDGATVKEAEAEAALMVRETQGPDVDSRVYGHQLFRNKTLEVYRASERARTPGTYVLDAGDELAISIFGASQTDLLLEIGEDGFIKPPGIPRIYLRGRSLSEARELVRSRMGNYYVFGEGQFALTVDAARTISVSVYGEVEQSGTYTLSALNGPLNALVAAGGPTERGTVRKIQLIRNGERMTIDVYAFLQNPTSGVATATLRDKDIINVPLAAKVVELRGAVRRPLRYELSPGERLDTLLAYAGGLTPSAILGATRVVRLADGRLRVLDIDLTDFTKFDLADGDVVEIPAVDEPLEDFVQVSGAVIIAGRFGYEDGITIGEVLTRARLRPTARRDVGFVRRRNDDGTERLLRVSLEETSGDLRQALKRGDVLSILPADRFVDDATITVSGAIRDSSLTFAYPQDGRLTLEEAILLAGGLETNALTEALIIRTPEENRERRTYLRVDLNQASGTSLMPNDRIRLYQRERFEDNPTVSISGAVRSPTEVRYDSSLSIDDLLYMAGGASFSAARNRVEVYRLSLEGNETKTLVETLELSGDARIQGPFQLRPFDEVFVRSSADFEPIQRIVLEGEVRYPGSYARIRGSNRVSDFVTRAGGLTDEAFAAGATLYREGTGSGFVVLELNEILADPAKPENLVLRAGDRVTIPKPQQVVTIYTRGTNAARYGMDSSRARGTIQVAFQGKRSAKWYVNNYAGGFNDALAKKRRTTVTSAAGGLEKTGSFLGVKNYPNVPAGGVVRVGLKEKKPNNVERERSSWSDLAQITVAALSAIATVLIVVTR